MPNSLNEINEARHKLKIYIMNNENILEDDKNFC